ncbi:MAG TPA: 4-(cytidine 5'-diphospho)-2-C-methyl-D-erythritol kinase [Burkholderiales bacterium]|nr:4-(cytidine 5'-diphospho)-2-C-methyl-D-erythritol kinase [Burkholderiales bacterium]
MNTFFAPAKLNLFLHVVGRRPDGYHLLESVFQLLDFGDTLEISMRADGAIRRVGEVAGVAEDDDLAIRAARALQAAGGTPQGADIAVRKRIPMGGGLGGGSSDAASVLLALNHLWGLRCARAQLAAIGLKLGADVPFFIHGENAFAAGIGEQLTTVDLPQRWFVVLKPPVAIPTVEIFRDPNLTRDTKSVKILDFPAGGWSFPQTRFANDLQPVALARYPAVARTLEWLARHDGQATMTARMTGSGACVFAAFGSESEARGILEARPREIEGFVARSLARHPLAGLAD